MKKIHSEIKNLKIYHSALSNDEINQLGCVKKMKQFYLVDINCALRTRAIMRKRWYHSIIGVPFLTVDLCEASNAKAAVSVFTARHGNSYVIL